MTEVKPRDTTIEPKAYIIAVKAILNQLQKATNVHWSDTDEGKMHVDPFPNPKQYLIGDLGPVGIAVNCGPSGIGIGPGH
jgi:hypothetical protein